MPTPKHSRPKINLPLFLTILLPAALGGGLVAEVQADVELPEATEGIPGSDDWIEARLITAYTLNEHLSFHDIRVDAEKGRVALAGAVPTDTQRRLAEQLAHDLVAARSIDNQLEVRPDAAAGDDNSLYRLVQDANISTRIELQLLWSGATQGTDIKVRTNNGKVRLDGSAASQAEKQAAERIALRTEGVRGLSNNIEVKPDTAAPSGTEDVVDDTIGTITDTWITERVSASLRFDAEIKDAHIVVATDDGVVSLTGKVRSAEQKQQAAEIAGGIAGVSRVDNQLEVHGSA